MEMEDLTTTSSLDGTILKLSGKLDRLLRHGYTLPKGVADEVPLIKADLEKIAAVSSDLEDDHAMTARCWRKEVRELSYDMEDFVDQYEHDYAVSCSRSMIRGRKIATQQRRKSKIGLPWLREKLRQRLWMANKIREFSARTQEALQRHSLYNLDAIAGASASSRRTCAYSDPAWNPTPCGEENAYVGISDAMAELLMMMHDDHGHQKLKVVSIVGSGGIGKTTLATEIYRKLGQQFECRAFVRTSQKPDMRRIFISMLSQVRPHQPPDNWTVHCLISTIRSHLQDKRYLIIVEDLCTASTWDIIKYALPDSNSCSRILTTTEIEDLALQSCDHDPKYVYKMKPLGEDNSRKLFFGLVFGPQHECPPELREISCNIISKCGGLPLAIVTVASILSSQPCLQRQWDYVNKSIGEGLLTNPTWEGMKQVLDLSYNNLPQQLKACILYTSLYEEDIIIWKDDLVNQWIAEGFIQTIGGQDKKEIGRSFFDRLISGKLILPVDINRNGEVLSCVVHRMVLNLVIRDKSMEENFVTAIHHSQADTTLADKIRRLSLQFGNAEDAMPPSNMRLSHVRTLAFSGVFKCLPSIEQFRLLKVLILHFWGDKDIISFDITRISELFRLRYLKVASNVTLELGTQMRCLQSLETLEIDARVSAVPSDIVQLPGLLHLRLPAETNLPNGIGHMVSLRTLGYFDLSSNSLENVQSLSMLNNLGDLQLTCSKNEPESLNMKTLFLLMNMILERLRNLKSLTLVPTRTSSYYTKSIDDDTGATCMTISDGFSTLSSAPALQVFEVSPRICIFLCTPKWIGHLHKLSILKFGVRKIDRDGVDVLRGLPALAVLSLYVHTNPAARIVIGKTGFPVIKYFKLKCCDPCLEFEEGAMPNLRKLKLAFNACNADRPSTMPVGINYLSELKEVYAKIGGAEESHTRTAELAFRDAIRVHAGCQSVNVQCVKQIIGGEDDQSSQISETTAEHPRIQYPPSPAQAPDRNQNRHQHQHCRDSIPREQTTVRQMSTSISYEDGYQWMKSGQRMINNELFPSIGSAASPPEYMTSASPVQFAAVPLTMGYGRLPAVMGMWGSEPFKVDSGGHATSSSTVMEADTKFETLEVPQAALEPGRSTDQETSKPSERVLRRLAQNRESARKNRLRKKAYIQQLETSRIKLAQLEAELQRARHQGAYAHGKMGDSSLGYAGPIDQGVAAFEIDYSHWVDEQKRHTAELMSALQGQQTSELELRLLVETGLSNYEHLFRIKAMAANADVFHVMSGMWKTPAERFFLWIGGFRPSEVLKILRPQLEPLTEQQHMLVGNLQHTSMQAEDALTSQVMEKLQQNPAETLTAEADPFRPPDAYMLQMATAVDRLKELVGFVTQADHLRLTTLQQMQKILTTRQAARGLLALGDYFQRLRTLSSLWAARPREAAILDASGRRQPNATRVVTAPKSTTTTTTMTTTTTTMKSSSSSLYTFPTCN